MGDAKRIGALIILNGEPLQEQVLDLVWPLTSASLEYPRICADGAADLLYNISAKSENPSPNDHPESKCARIPSHIVGDLDSVTPAVRTHFAQLGTLVMKMSSLDSNDFEKALSVAAQSPRVTEEDLPILVIGGMAGRMDQTLANINQLYCCSEQGLQVLWLSRQNLLVMLAPGAHKIEAAKGSKCGLIPIGGPVKSVTTTGLRWDMTEQKLAFGTHNLVSTSNETVENRVCIKTSDPVLWTVEVNII